MCKNHEAAAAVNRTYVTKSMKVIAILLGVTGPFLFHLSAGAAVPAQYIAKMYTETLGRAPDPAAWNGALGYFEPNGCTQTTLTRWGTLFFSSAEFHGLGYDNAATALLLYRAILDREPDPRGYSHYLDLLDSGMPLETVVSMFFSSREFSGLVPLICGGGRLQQSLQQAMATSASSAGGTTRGDLGDRGGTGGDGGVDGAIAHRFAVTDDHRPTDPRSRNRIGRRRRVGA